MFKNYTTLIATVIALFANQCMFWLLFIERAALPPQVPLWNSLPWSEARLAPVEALWLLPGFGILILAINLGLLFAIYRRQPFLVNFVIWVTAIINVFLLIVTIRIVGIVLGWL